MFRIKLGLEKMRKSLDILGLSPGKVPVVQVVGTNAKGSTACFLESLARFSGLKTGLYTSPHLVSVKERIKINNRLLPDEDWLSAANEVLERCSSLELTYFELITVMAVYIFEQQDVDAAILEAGLGGRLDATSAVHPALNVFTPVGLDHTHILGNTLEEIARDKSMAMRRGPAVLAKQKSSVMDVFKARAKEVGAELHCVQDCFDFPGNSLRPGFMPEMSLTSDDMILKGNYQLHNAATALLAWKILAQTNGYEFSRAQCESGIKKAFWPGRMHIVQKSPMIILDGAHNVSAMKALKSALKNMNIRPGTIIFSCLHDKDVQELVGAVRGLGAQKILVPDVRDNSRAMPKEELASLFGPSGCILKDTGKYLSGLEDNHEPVVICGSLYLLGDVYAEFPQWLRVDI